MLQRNKNVAKDGEIPSIYVNTPVLDIVPFHYGDSYTINGANFYAERREDNRILEFELFRQRVVDRKMDSNNFDTYCSTPSESGSEHAEDSTAPLPISVQKLPNGVLINSIIFLPNQHWHTLVSIDDHMVSCVVCSTYCEGILAWGQMTVCDLSRSLLFNCSTETTEPIFINEIVFYLTTATQVGASSKHIETNRHSLYMKMYKPLERFELSITRKVRESYHCGVCNEIFYESGVVEHFASKMHEGNLLFAINKASDIIYDEAAEPNNNTDKANCYHFNANNIIEEHNTGYDDYDYVPNNYDFIDYKQNDFVEYDDDEEYYGELAGDHEQFKGTSYATMAKKPIVDQKKFLEIDLGNKTVKVRFNSWHMIISPQQSRYYCMVCKRFDHIRLKIDHCQDEEHLKRLAKCRVVETFQDHFIRRVDDKLYHCGHCNNLQLYHLMQHHIDKVHPKKQKTTDKTLKTPDDSDNSISRKIQEILLEQTNANNSLLHIGQNGTNGALNSSNKSNDSFKSFKRIDNYDMMIIHPFGYELVVSKLAYNMVCKRLENFYCCLCDVTFDEDEVTRHLKLAGHQQTLHRTPYIRPFSCNLIRAIREALHCTLCNMPVSADKIYNHVVDPIHVFMLKSILDETDEDSTKDKRSPSQASLASDRSPKIDNSVKNQPATVKTQPTPVKNQPATVKTQPTPVKTQPATVKTQPTPVKNQPATVKKEPVKVEPKVINNKEITNHNNVKEPHLAIKEINNGLSELRSPAKKLKEKVRNDSERSINGDNNKAINNDTNNAKSNSYEEFSIVPYRRHSIEEATEDLDRTFDSNASDEVLFDSEEYVYLKLKNTYIKISNSAYNTLVYVGDGSRYCFVCAIQVHYADVLKHVDSRSHLENIERHLFLDKYEDHLLRQIYLNYHCSICNVIVTRKELKNHLDWPTHALQIEDTQKNIKKARKTEIKGGVKQIIISTQKENIYLNEKESHNKIHYHVNIVAKKKTTESDSNFEVAATNNFKKNKIIIFNDNVLKFSWESWHGVARIKNGFKCNLCQRELNESEIETHCNSEWHKYSLDKPYEKQYLPALIRKVNQSTLNCLICNTEVSNKEHLVNEHIKGKKHKTNYEIIVKDSSTTNTYTDCIGDVLML